MSEAATGAAKRKREEDIVVTPLPFSFEVARSVDSTDGHVSPRLAVAYRLKGLDLQVEPGARPSQARELVFGSGSHGEPGSSRTLSSQTEPPAKRQRCDVEMLGGDVPLPASVVPDAARETERDGSVATVVSDGKMQTSEETSPLQPPGSGHTRSEATGHLHEALEELPKPNAPEGLASETMRAVTPPLRGRKKPSASRTTKKDETTVDPARAALTWQEDEITIYDPNDEDDNGTGVNGVGFKPSPAMREALQAKRRQQLAEWRRREDSDARARRTQRRRGHQLSTTISSSPPGSQGSTTDGRTPRKVRFREAEAKHAGVLSK